MQKFSIGMFWANCIVGLLGWILIQLDKAQNKRYSWHNRSTLSNHYDPDSPIHFFFHYRKNLQALRLLAIKLRNKMNNLCFFFSFSRFETLLWYFLEVFQNNIFLEFKSFKKLAKKALKRFPRKLNFNIL